MKIPARLAPLVEDGIIDDVLGQVKSGKEADVFIVRVGEEVRCAKVYKEANNRSFRQAVQYQEGRSVQNSRSARAMSKRTRYGQKEAEASWINAEVEALTKLAALGLRVPKPYGFFDGVLIMELIVDAEGNPAPRLNDLSLSADVALSYHEELIAQIVRMLCAGIIHGDLSEFNVLVDADGPVIIDLPQAVNAAGNNSAAMMFERDVDNMARYFGRFEPAILTLKYAKEIWALYEKGKLTPHTELTGQYEPPKGKVDVSGVLTAIGDARKEHEDILLKKNPPRLNAGARTGDPGGPGEGKDAHLTEGGRDGRHPQGGRGPRPHQGGRSPNPHPGGKDPRQSQGGRGGPPRGRDDARQPQGGRNPPPPGERNPNGRQPAPHAPDKPGPRPDKQAQAPDKPPSGNGQWGRRPGGPGRNRPR